MTEDQIDIRRLIAKALRYWYLFAIFLLVSSVATYVYLLYAPPKYSESALLMIKDEKESGQLSEESLFADLGLGKNDRNLENERRILASSPLMIDVVRNLELQYRYFSIHGIIKREMYKNSPIQILDWQPKWETAELDAKLEIEEKGGQYRLEVEDEGYLGEFGKELELPFGNLTLTRKQESADVEKMGLLILPAKAMANEILDNLSVDKVDEKKSSILSLSLTDVSPERLQDILNELIKVYNQQTIATKNRVFENTIDMINERVGLIVDELSVAELNEEEYKRRFNMVELSAEGTMLMTELATYQKEISGTDVQLEILNSIEEFLKKNEDTFEFVPTNMSITNLTLANQLTSFNALLAERDRMRVDLGPSHPNLIVTEKQIRNLRKTIIDNVQSIKRDLEIARNASAGNRENLQTRLRSLPQRERELVEIQRQKVVKENLYLYLLQKREESAISLAITEAKGVIVEPPGKPRWPFSPNKIQLWLAAIFMGLAIPMGIIVLLDLLNNKIEEEDDIHRATTVPMAGMILQSRRNERLVVKENSRSVAAEMFRLLRANFAYISPGKELSTVLITSGISGEGKSYIALNLGMVQALSNKKVIIIELDLRKPKQELYMGSVKADKGIVNYLVEASVTIDDIILNSGVHPNLDIIVCGPKPPNPSELLLSQRLRQLLEELKEQYDFIILDAPPVGMVADPLQLRDLVEATLFVLRANYSRKPELQLVNNIAEHDKLPRPFIVLNGVRLSKGGYTTGYGYGYSYGYGYGYGNGNGYYEEDSEPKKWWRIFKKKAKKTEKTNNALAKGQKDSTAVVPKSKSKSRTVK